MKVLVTGGSGKVGRWVIRELAEHGYEMINADLRPPTEDEGRVSGAMVGCEAVVHLGGIPDPSEATGRPPRRCRIGDRKERI